MTSNDLSWSEVAERAESVHNLNSLDSTAAMGRVKALLSFMEKNIKAKPPPGPSFFERISKAKFLPVLKKPEIFRCPGREMNLKIIRSLHPKKLTQQKQNTLCVAPNR